MISSTFLIKMYNVIIFFECFDLNFNFNYHDNFYFDLDFNYNFSVSYNFELNSNLN
jgi:hypothetical protein